MVRFVEYCSPKVFEIPHLPRLRKATLVFFLKKRKKRKPEGKGPSTRSQGHTDSFSHLRATYPDSATPVRSELPWYQPPNSPANALALAGAPAQACRPTENSIFGHYIHSLTPSDPAHGWTETLEFLSSKELAVELER